MQMNDLFLAELEREAAVTRRVLERVPEGRNDWKPHPKSMPLGYLAALVATMPSWIEMIIEHDQIDMKPGGEFAYQAKAMNTPRELVSALDEAVANGRAALSHTNDDHLLTPWRFLVSGRVVSEMPRYICLRDTVLNHLAHHRGQLTVYLRLNDAPVPSIYGPTADEPMFT